MELLAHVWQEVSRHVEIREVAERLLPDLGAVFPVSGLAVRRIDLSQSCLETVACCAGEGTVPVTAGKTPLNEAELKRFLNWAEQGTATSLHENSAPVAGGTGPERAWLGDSAH